MLPASLELVEFHGMPRTSLTFLELLIFQRVLEDDPGVTRSIDWYKCSRLPVDPWMRACKLFFSGRMNTCSTSKITAIHTISS